MTERIISIRAIMIVDDVMIITVITTIRLTRLVAGQMKIQSSVEFCSVGIIIIIFVRTKQDRISLHFLLNPSIYFSNI